MYPSMKLAFLESGVRLLSLGLRNARDVAGFLSRRLQSG
jgi:hypothetical protein